MSSIDVARLRALLERRSGLDLGRGGMEANLVSFVNRRLTANDLSFERYMDQVEVPGNEELRQLVEAMTVIYTWFFRDPGQFIVIEQLIRNFTPDRIMGIWVAGCATGEEPYSVALVAADLGRRVDILATDLNSAALRHAKAGRYAVASLSAVDATMRARYLDGSSGDYLVPEAAKQRVRFQVGNLVEAPPRAVAPEGWDLVICRNVLIYFGREQARRTLDALAGSLAPGGALVLGASEGILERPSTLNVVGVSGRAVLVRPRNGDFQLFAPRVPELGTPLPQSQPKSPVPNAYAAPSGLATDANIECTPRQNELVRPSVASPMVEIRPPTLLIASDAIRTSTARTAIEHGHSALDAGNILAARESYLHALSLVPSSAEAMMFVGITYYLDGALTDALYQLRGALCLDASLWAAWFYQALCYDNMGYSEDAVRNYSQVVNLAGQQTQLGEEHPFLKGWRHDLVAVATKRANQGISQRGASRLRPRAQNDSHE
jgi:chemotaxis protein methyltransferase CheR